MHAFDALNSFLLRMASAGLGVRRWKHYPTPSGNTGETITEHHLTTGILALIMLMIEQTHPNGRDSEIHGYHVLMAALIHDMGEIKVDDQPWAEGATENGQRRKAEEHAYVRGLLKLLPPQIAAFMQIAYDFDSDNESVTGRFFTAVEAVGYMVCAIPRFKNGELAYIETFRNQQPRLLEMAKEFVSVQVMYVEPYAEWVEEQLKIHQDREVIFRTQEEIAAGP
jgi:5'-deoxynucleotidase YfbR-like HD superfamily hydrolase